MKIFYCENGSRTTTFNIQQGELAAINDRIKELPPDTFAFQDLQTKVSRAVRYWNAQPDEMPREFDIDEDGNAIPMDEMDEFNEDFDE